MASNAIELFKWIGDEKTAQKQIKTMIEERQVENSFLDYKHGSRLQDKDVSRLWSESLSAYANTGGGVVIWGVQCKPTTNKKAGVILPDEPSGEPALHPNAVALRKRLADLVRTSTTDTVEGVQILAVPFDNGPAGCVVCYIPEGKNKPYRATFDENYHMRQPDRMEIIPHELLRSLFYPKMSPQIDISVLAKPPIFQAGSSTVIIEFWTTVTNNGNGSAGELFIDASFSHEMRITKAVPESWEIILREQQPTLGYYRSQFAARRSIHPSFTQDLCCFKIIGTSDLYMSPTFDLFFDIYSSGTEPRKLDVQFSAKELLKKTPPMPVSRTATPRQWNRPAVG